MYLLGRAEHVGSLCFLRLNSSRKNVPAELRTKQEPGLKAKPCSLARSGGSLHNLEMNRDLYSPYSLHNGHKATNSQF